MKILTTTTDYEALHRLAEQDERIKPLLPHIAANTLKVSELKSALKGSDKETYETFFNALSGGKGLMEAYHLYNLAEADIPQISASLFWKILETQAFREEVVEFIMAHPNPSEEDTITRLTINVMLTSSPISDKRLWFHPDQATRVTSVCHWDKDILEVAYHTVPVSDVNTRYRILANLRDVGSPLVGEAPDTDPKIQPIIDNYKQNLAKGLYDKKTSA